MFILGLQTGEDLLGSLDTFIKEKGIKNGVVVSGVGSLRKLEYHYVVAGPDETKPVLDIFDTRTGYIEIVGLQGVIADGQPHLHISCAEEDRGYGGHLEPGSEVLTVCEIAVLSLPDASLVRTRNSFGYPVIDNA